MQPWCWAINGVLWSASLFFIIAGISNLFIGMKTSLIIGLTKGVTILHRLMTEISEHRDETRKLFDEVKSRDLWEKFKNECPEVVDRVKRIEQQMDNLSKQAEDKIGELKSMGITEVRELITPVEEIFVALNMAKAAAYFAIAGILIGISAVLIAFVRW